MGIWGEVLAALTTRGEDRATALICPDDSRPLTYLELRRQVESLAEDLSRAGVGGGDCVAFSLPNGPETIVLLLAVTAVGAAAAPLNPAYTADEYSFYLRDLSPCLLVLPGHNERAEAAASQLGLAIAEVTLGGAGEPPRLRGHGRSRGRATADGRLTPESVALLLHTSGTTGRPRVVPLSHGNLASSAQAIAAWYSLGASDRTLCVMPLFHVHGLVGSVFSTLASGGTAVVPRRTAPRSVWRQVRELDITWYSATPTLHQALLESLDAEKSPSLRFVRSCSSALPPALFHELEERLSVPALQAYGMTEASHQIASNPLPPGARKPGSVGRATGTELRIVGPDRGPLPDGREGEVQVRGSGVMRGYLSPADGTTSGLEDGWLSTGDSGVLEDGYLWLKGRLKEMINRGGESIAPYEIEQALLAHPAVADAACFGTPSPKYGEEVAAAVVTSAAADGRELQRYCRERLAPFKVPKSFFFVDAIPRTATGKVRRQVLSQELQAG